MTNELVLCPVCIDGWVWYDGTTPPTGDDPSEWVQCSTCKGKFMVRKDWADHVLPNQEECEICHRDAAVASVFIIEDPDLNVLESVCYPCFDKLIP